MVLVDSFGPAVPDVVCPPQGFVSENPTAPIQLPPQRPPSCRSQFCRLGCVCSSLTYCGRSSHCGRAGCMLRCSCLKQKVVLLKNLEGSDSSPSHHGNKRRKRRMKMAYGESSTSNIDMHIYLYLYLCLYI